MLPLKSIASSESNYCVDGSELSVRRISILLVARRISILLVERGISILLVEHMSERT